jgi:hypothetical protein
LKRDPAHKHSVLFITDGIARKEVAIQYCPTKEMVAHYFTKLLQGQLFYKFRDQIMGVVPMATIMGDHRSVLDVDPIVLEKLANPDDLVSGRLEGAHGKRKVIRKADAHQSWADMVKARPLNPANASFQPLYKR